MTQQALLEYKEAFHLVNSGEWVTLGLDVQFKVIGKTLYFQCSRSWNDWKNNFRFWMVPYDDMEEKFYVHKGFLEMWKSVREVILKYDIDTIIGYSLGGALAILAHEDFTFHTGKQPRTIVFGCPRVIWFPSKSIRARFSRVEYIQNPRDIVTHLPPSIFGYRRVYGKREVLRLPARKPAGYYLSTWASGHSPEEYRQRLGGECYV